MFCLEVFEHLPPSETTDTLQTIYKLLKPKGIIVIGVPVEIGMPALYKGIFRMIRRYGAFDANLKNIFLSFCGYPPRNRPISSIAQGVRFYYPHTGFDFRNLKKIIQNYFQLQKVSTSPFKMLGTCLMPEVYFIANKKL